MINNTSYLTFSDTFEQSINADSVRQLQTILQGLYNVEFTIDETKVIGKRLLGLCQAIMKHEYEEKRLQTYT